MIPQGLGTQREKSHEKKTTCFRQFWVKEPRHEKTTSNKKCYLRRSTRLTSLLPQVVRSLRKKEVHLYRSMLLNLLLPRQCRPDTCRQARG